MADTLVGATSLGKTVRIGTNLASVITPYLATKRFPESLISDLAAAIYSSAGTLRQLQQIVESDNATTKHTQHLKTLKDDGHAESQSRAAQVEQVYRTVIILITKAGASRSKGKQKMKDINTEELKPSVLSRNYNWSWLQPRIKRAVEQLEFLNKNVLLILQLARLAQYQVRTIQRVPGLFEDELALRLLGERMRQTNLKEVKKLARKYKIVPSPASSSVSSLAISLPAQEGERNDVPIVAKNQNDGPASTPQSAPHPPVASNKPSIAHPPPYSEAASGGRPNPNIEKSIVPANPDVIPPVVKPVEIGTPSKSVNIPSSATFDEKAKTKDGEIIVKADENVMNIDGKEYEAISMSTFESKFGGVQSWFKGIFGSANKYLDDKKSNELDAFMVLGDRAHLRVPFGHRRLKLGLKQLMKKNSGSTLDDFYGLPKHLQGAISHVRKRARVEDSRERVCICFEVLKMGEKPVDQHLLVFFKASGPPVAPIHFRDAVGRKFIIPYYLADTWEEMKAVINIAFLHVDVLGPHVTAGRYDLITSEGNIVLAVAWDGIVKPGISISMHMWPMSEPPRRPPMPRFPPPAPFGPPPPPMRRPAGMPPPPPPPGFGPRGPGPVIVQEKPKPRVTKWRGTNLKRRSSLDSFTDSSAFDSDSDIEDEDEDLGLDIDFEKEKEKAERSLSDLLSRWTYAIDTESAPIDSDDYDSSSGSGSDTSLVDD